MASRLERLEFAIGMRDEASKKVGALRKSLSGMANTVHNQMLKIGTGWLGAKGLGSSIEGMVSPAIDLNRALGEVGSLDVGKEALADLQSAAENFAMEYGGTAAQVVSSSYDIQSAISGLSGKELATFTAAGGTLAKATKADVGTITSYMGTMYGIFKNQAERMGKATWVEQLAGQTATAVQMFKTTGTELSAAFTAVGANATSAGIAASEQMAVLGTLQSTMSGSEAGTKYKAFLAGVGNAQKTLGMQFTDSQGNMLGMVEILGKLKARFGDTFSVAEGDVLKKAFGSDEAVSLIKQLMADTGGLASSIDALGQVQGMNKARQMAARMTDIWAQLGGALSTVSASFGQKLLPPLAMVGRKFLDVLKTLNRWINIAPNVARWIGYGAIAAMSLAAAMGVLAAATAVSKLALLGIGGPLRIVGAAIGFLTKVTGMQTAAQWLLNGALWANPTTWVVVGIIALIAAVGALIYWWDDLKAAFLDTSWGQAIMATIEALLAPIKALGGAWDWLKSKFGADAAVNASITKTTSTVAAAVEAPAQQSSSPMLEAPRTAAVPAGGLMRSYANTVNRNSAKQTTIGQVHINSQTPMTPAELDEWAALGAG